MKALAAVRRRAFPLAAFLFLTSGALPGADLMRVGEVSAQPGGTGVAVPIIASRDQAIQGFSVSVWYDPAILSCTGVGVEGTAVAALLPEYSNSKIDPAQGNVLYAAILEISPPIDLVSLPAGGPEPLAILRFDVAGAALGLIPLELRDSPGPHPIRNLFVVLGESVLPTLQDGAIAIAADRFRRGYVNADTRVDISDAIFLLGYIFLGGQEPVCLAAGDTNGDRRVDLSDAVWLLNYVFQGDRSPAEPFLECGAIPPGFPLPCGGQPVCP
jgi:hypothetical protein